MKDSTTKSKIISPSIWLIIWELVARTINNQVLIPRPLQVFKSLIILLGDKNTLISILNTFYKISSGYLIALVFGIALGILSYKYKWLKNFFDLPMNFIRSVPIASIVIIILIWFNSDLLPLIIVFLIVSPNIYYTSYKGLEDVSRELLEMSKVFGVKNSKVIRYIYFEKLKVFLGPSLISTSGLAWKSGISGEVMGLVSKSIGENIYYSKLYLNTSDLFAWTIIIILLSQLSLLIINFIIKKVD